MAVYRIPAIDLSIKPLNVPFSITTGESVDPCWVLLYNESPYLLNLDFPDGAGEQLNPFTADWYYVAGNNLSVTPTQLLSLTNPPSTKLLVRVYTSGQPHGNYPLDLSRQLAVGNVINTVSLTNWFDVVQYGATGKGVVDDSAAIAAAIAAAAAAGGGIIYFPAGSYLVSQQFVLNTQGQFLYGDQYASRLLLSPTFPAASVFLVSANNCGADGIRIGNTSSAGGNPAVIGFQLCNASASARYFRGRNLFFENLNSWGLEAVSGALGIDCVGMVLEGIHWTNCYKGIHLQGTAASLFLGQAFLTDIHLEQILNGDGLLIEDINDILVENINGACTGPGVTGSTLHVKGGASNFFKNLDVGMLTGPSTVSPTILVETGAASGAPSNVSFQQGVVQQGNQGIQVTAGQDIAFSRLKIKNNNGDGAQVNTTTHITFDDCVFAGNNQGNGTAYDLNVLSTGGDTWAKGCRFETTTGAGAGLVTASVHDANSKGTFWGCNFVGAASPSAVFSGTPQIVQHSPGYNPRGSITAPVIGASPFVTNSSQNNILVIFTTIATLTAFKIGGTATSVLPTAGVPYHIPARQSLELDYSGAAPTWQWYAD